MNIVIRDSPLGLFYYRQKPVTAGLGRPCQNYLFIAPFRPQDWFSLFPESYENWFRGEYNQLTTDLCTTEIIQIPIVFRHSEISCLRPAASSLGACDPTMAYQAIGMKPWVGAMLPCIVILREIEGGVQVSAVNPVASMMAIENDQLKDVAAEVRALLADVVESI